MRWLPTILLTALLASAARGAPATRPATDPATRPALGPPPTARAILITGLGGSKAYSRNLADWTRRCRAVLTGQCGVKPANVLVLTETGPAALTKGRARSTLENVRAAMKKTASALRDGDQFILFLAGHGQINEPVGKLCLPGADLKADELGEMLDDLPTDRIVVINCASGGAEFVATLAVAGRVIISGAGGGSDGNQTYFAEFFLRGYETREADADKDKQIDLLEAFTYGAREIAHFYHRQYLVPARGPQPAGAPLTWNVRGRQTRAIWRRLYVGTNHRLAPRTGRGDPDQEPDPTPVFGKFDRHWHFRRVLAEHARLDDEGSRKGFFLWQPYEFRKTLPDVPGEIGYLARRTVLGKPELLERGGSP
jgi:hypothetical protein